MTLPFPLNMPFFAGCSSMHRTSTAEYTRNPLRFRKFQISIHRPDIFPVLVEIIDIAYPAANLFIAVHIRMGFEEILQPDIHIGINQLCGIINGIMVILKHFTFFQLRKGMKPP